jgi:hypothetical protein
VAAIDLARDYIARVNGRDGQGASALFAEDGVIVDPRGGRHEGRAAIAAFVSAAPPGTLAQLADRTMGTHRVVLHGVVHTQHLAPSEIEWEFEVDANRIRQLTIRLLNAPPHGGKGAGSNAPAPAQPTGAGTGTGPSTDSGNDE